MNIAMATSHIGKTTAYDNKKAIGIIPIKEATAYTLNGIFVMVPIA